MERESIVVASPSGSATAQSSNPAAPIALTSWRQEASMSPWSIASIAPD
jgi:hypothetical protein